jgi:alkylated DNA repair dioxygenase AlkB
MARSESSPGAATVAEPPDGLLYVPEFVSELEEEALVDAFEGATFSEVRMHGQPARRTVLHFGYRYDYESWALTPARPLPPWLGGLRDRASALVGLEAAELAETLVTRYPAGAGIGWHRDAPMFGPQVVGVSLVSSCRMRFQRRTRGLRQVHAIELAARSAYVLEGPARSVWQHSIPATKALRYSVTFRTVDRRSDGVEERGSTP